MNILEYENIQETKTHGNLHFPFNIYLCSIPLDFSNVPAHWHNDMEIIYIKKGRGKITVDLSPYEAADGDILFVSPGQLHSIEELPGHTMEYENIIFQLNMLMSAQGDLSTEQFLQPLLQHKFRLPVYLTKGSKGFFEITQCLDDIDRLSSRGDSLSTLGIKGRLFDLFFLLFEQKEVLPTGTRAKSLDSLRLILKHVETHYQERLTIEAMASVSGFSCSHFMRFFKGHMGISFIEYLNEYRLAMAARMLTVSTDTVVTIAGESGFENLSYFNRLFKRKYGMTPTDFRNRPAAAKPSAFQAE